VRGTLARNIRDHDIDAAIGAVKHIIEVAGYDPRRHASGGDSPSGAAELGRRQRTALDIARHFQLTTPEFLRHQFIELKTLHGEGELSGGSVSISYGRLVEMISWMHGKSRPVGRGEPLVNSPRHRQLTNCGE